MTHIIIIIIMQWNINLKQNISSESELKTTERNQHAWCNNLKWNNNWISNSFKWNSTEI
jgi:hypothetical protein